MLLNCNRNVIIVLLVLDKHLEIHLPLSTNLLFVDREILDKLEYEKILVYTPSRCINGRRVTCYDDRFILRLAQETEGVIVSNDHFRDLQNEKPEWKELIEKRLLMYSFVNDRLLDTNFTNLFF